MPFILVSRASRHTIARIFRGVLAGSSSRACPQHRNSCWTNSASCLTASCWCINAIQSDSRFSGEMAPDWLMTSGVELSVHCSVHSPNKTYPRRRDWKLGPSISRRDSTNPTARCTPKDSVPTICLSFVPVILSLAPEACVRAIYMPHSAVTRLAARLLSASWMGTGHGD